jgi:hypothetical protein
MFFFNISARYLAKRRICARYVEEWRCKRYMLYVMEWCCGDEQGSNP